jgi:hypothetical protein
MAAFFSACFLVFAGSPAKLIPASSTVDANTGECPGPERTVVYAGSFSPARCAVSCSRFLYTPVSSCSTRASKHGKSLPRTTTISKTEHVQITRGVDYLRGPGRRGRWRARVARGLRARPRRRRARPGGAWCTRRGPRRSRR